mgnify:CR=1 FL=1
MNSENLKRIVVSVVLSCLAPSFAMAADLENGERIFSANCSACHAGGNNVIIPEKTLKKVLPEIIQELKNKGFQFDVLS